MEEILKKLNKDQRPIFDKMQNSTLLNVCSPTGFGKGYIMMIDLYKRVLKSDEKIFAIATHRLLLNTQHMNDIIQRFKDELSNLIFVFVGSQKYKMSNDSKSILRKNRITETELIKNVTNNEKLKLLLEKYNDKKIINYNYYSSSSTI
jgi:hypothetical protein